MKDKKLKVLLIVEQCNPEWASVPLVGFKYYEQISQIANVTLVTHQRNQPALAKLYPDAKITFIKESQWLEKYHQIVSNISYKGKTNWPLYNALSYPIYAEFNHQVYQQYKLAIQEGQYDIVHALTPMMPRYPVKVVKVCNQTPLILGPVNGGVPFPKGFEAVARKEFAYFNFLRAWGRTLIPGYKETYKKADKILVGSTYTLNLLKNLFSLGDDKVQLFYENGIDENFLLNEPTKSPNTSQLNLLFVGRLVPYKGCDMLIEAISRLEDTIKHKLTLTIVGEGSEKEHLEQLVKEKNLENLITFTGWIKQQETVKYYQQADIFCFPSVREFGGAVVLEAMGCGLPCLVVNNGGIGEYVTESTGFKIEPLSKEYVIEELTKIITQLEQNREIIHTMSQKSIQRVQEFTWENKGKKILDIYHEIIAN